MEKIRVAFIGMDHVHVQTLANDFVKYPDRIDIVGIADYPSHNPDTWQNKKKLNFPQHDLKVWEDYKELAAQNIDLALVTTNIKDHADCAVELLGMGIHTLLEKPMATSMADAKRMYDAYKNSTAQLIVNWPIAWFPAFRKAKELSDASAVGRILRVQYRSPSTRGPYKLGDHTEDELKQMWWYQSDKGGGSICDYAGYGCTLATWFTGKTAKRVMGMKKNFFHPFAADIEDYSVFTIDFGDSIGLIEGSWSTMNNGQIATGPIVYGSEGVIVADRYDTQVKIYRDLLPYQPSPTPNEVYDIQPIEDNIAINVADFIQKGEPLFDMITAEFNMKVMVAFDAGIRSCNSGIAEEGTEI